MFFRNLTLMRFPTTTKLDELDTGLDECQLKPVGPLELSSRGFISPFGRGAAALSHTQGDATWVSVGGEDKILPGSVITDLLQKKLAEIEEKEGRKPGGRTRKRIKDELVTELLPRAFTKPTRTDALIDIGHGIVVVDTSSRKTAENVVSEIRRALGSFPALPLNAEVAPRSVLTGWVAGDPLPEGLSLGAECELRDPIDSKTVVKVSNMELQSDEIAKHLESGKQVTRLALVLDDHVSFVLGEDLVIRKFKLLDGAVESLENTERDDLAAELDARFILMAAEVRRLFAVLEVALKLSKADAGADVSARARPAAANDAEAAPTNDESDPIYPQALIIVNKDQKASIAGIQRQLSIGYNRAARLIEKMEEDGAVSAPAADGNRSVDLKRVNELVVEHTLTQRMRDAGHEGVTVTMSAGR